MKKQTNYSEKPYNRCLACHHRIEKRCDGPRTSAMELKRWCEFMRDMKEANGLTNLHIAEKSDVSVKTIERLMALNCDRDIMRDTARRIEDAIIESSNQYPCHLAYEDTASSNEEKLNAAMQELERALTDNEDYRTALDNIHASYKAEMQTIRDEANAEKQAIREEAQKKVDYLLQQLEHYRKENENLWAENNRKSKVVDMFLEKQNVLLEKK